jgi:hypothetical protein
VTTNRKGGNDQPVPNKCTCSKGDDANYHDNDCATRFEPLCTSLNHAPGCGHLGPVTSDDIKLANITCSECRHVNTHAEGCPADPARQLSDLNVHQGGALPTPETDPEKFNPQGKFVCEDCGYLGRKHAKLCPENPETMRKATPTDEFMYMLKNFLNGMPAQDRDNMISGVTFRLQGMGPDDFVARLYEASCKPPEPTEEAFEDLLKTYTEHKRERDRHDEKMRMAYDSLLPRALDAYRAKLAQSGEQLVAVSLKGFNPARSHGSVQASLTNAEARAWVQAACMAYANQNLAQYGFVQHYTVFGSAARKDDLKENR